MAYPNIGDPDNGNKRTVGKISFYFDPLHQQVVGLTTVEIYRKTAVQIQTEIDTIGETAIVEAERKAELQAVLDGNN